MSGTVWLKVHAMGKEKEKYTHKPATQQLRQFKRIVVSTNTLLCEHFGIEQKRLLKEPLPISRGETLRLLFEIAEGKLVIAEPIENNQQKWTLQGKSWVMSPTSRCSRSP